MVRQGTREFAARVGTSSEFVGACIAAYPNGTIPLSIHGWSTRVGRIVPEMPSLNITVTPVLIDFYSPALVLCDVIGLADNVTRVRFEEHDNSMYLLVNGAELEAIRFASLTQQVV